MAGFHNVLELNFGDNLLASSRSWRQFFSWHSSSNTQQHKQFETINVSYNQLLASQARVSQSCSYPGFAHHEVGMWDPNLGTAELDEMTQAAYMSFKFGF